MATTKPGTPDTGEIEVIETETDVVAQEVPAVEEGVGSRQPEVDFTVPAGRLAVVVGFSTLAAATMVGGIYVGVTPRISAAVAGLLGVFAVIQVRKFRNPLLMNGLMVLSIVLAGLIVSIPKGSIGDLLSPMPFVREAATSGDVVRPPVEFTLGWSLIVGWLMAAIGFAAGWVAIEMRKAALGMMVPLPLVAFGAISVPGETTKIATGLACLVLFAIGLGMLSGIETGGDGEQRSLAFELRRAAKALPLIAGITIGLFFLAQTNFLFPPPLFDPTQSAQKPKTVPITDVPDRVLFTVDSAVTGPWRMGGLDIYDPVDGFWKLPPFAENRLEPVPDTGIIDSELQAGVKAQFAVKGLDGAVLPGLPNIVGMIAEGPFLAYDTRTGNIRLSQGTIQEGIAYIVTAAKIPTVDELRKVTTEIPPEINGVPSTGFTEIPPPPQAVAELLRKAPNTSRWDRLDFVRKQFLDTVVAEGQGVPVPVKVSRVQDMLAGSKTGTPFEIVAAQAMLARWVGIPSRIGYGYDGGDQVAGVLEIRPRHGASFLEVWFPGFKWLPIIGNPTQAKSSFSDQTQQNRNVQASDDIAVQLFVPFETDPNSFLFQQIRAAVLIVLPFFLFFTLLYFLWPILRKSLIRSRRRTWAQHQGPRARIALAYAEWRDLCTDFGYQNFGDTPLMFLDRVVADDEHTELGWLATRTLWGDLQAEISEDDALAAEEISRSLRKRMAQAHSFTLRAVAAISRLSLKHPFAPTLGILARKERSRASRKKAA